MGFLNNFGIIVGFELGTIRFKTLNDKVYLLERSRCGHLLIDFGPDAEWREVMSNTLSPNTSVVSGVGGC